MAQEETLTLPGLIDAHVHLREPGAPLKEDILSGTTAALAGGVVGVLDMPNNTPFTASRQALEDKLALFAHKAVTDYGLFVGFDEYNIAAAVEAAPDAVGLKLYLDETFAAVPAPDPDTLAALLEAWPGPGPIAIHADSPTIAPMLELAKRYDQHLHVCHVPHPDDLLQIDAARQRGVHVTCEITPHHLFLSTDDAALLGPFAQMKPPLLPRGVAHLFWERLGLVDLIATDHAPHTRLEKVSPNPPPGVPGLETMLPLLLYAVDRGLLTLERLQELTWHGPLRVFGLQAPADTAVDVAVGQPYILSTYGWHTRCGWSPYGGYPAIGRVRRVQIRGLTVWQSGTLLAAARYGQRLVRTEAAAS